MNDCTQKDCVYPATVLVVDDDSDELAAACKALGARHPVMAATSGDDALRAARATVPAVIVLDVMLAGGKDGFTVFRELQRDPVTRGIPVIFLTNVARATGLPFGPEAIETYLAARPAAFLEKPVPAERLLQTVARVLSRPPP